MFIFYVVAKAVRERFTVEKLQMRDEDDNHTFELTNNVRRFEHSLIGHTGTG